MQEGWRRRQGKEGRHDRRLRQMQEGRRRRQGKEGRHAGRLRQMQEGWRRRQGKEGWHDRLISQLTYNNHSTCRRMTSGGFFCYEHSGIPGRIAVLQTRPPMSGNNPDYHFGQQPAYYQSVVRTATRGESGVRTWGDCAEIAGGRADVRSPPRSRLTSICGWSLAAAWGFRRDVSDVSDLILSLEISLVCWREGRFSRLFAVQSSGFRNRATDELWKKCLLCRIDIGDGPCFAMRRIRWTLTEK